LQDSIWRTTAFVRLDARNGFIRPFRCHAETTMTERKFAHGTWATEGKSNFSINDNIVSMTFIEIVLFVIMIL
jgi:hypothetical protein